MAKRKDRSSTPAKAKLSSTRLDMFCKCPEAFRRRYIEGEIIPPGVSMLKGTGVHRGAQVNFTQKLETHRDLPAKDIVDAAVAGFQAEQKAGVSFTAEEMARGVANVVGEAIDEVAEMASLHARQQAPDYQPVLIEKMVEIILPTVDLVGVVDLADDQDRVVDFKTAGKSKSQGDADSSTQLTIYSALYKAETGRDAKELRLDTIVRTKRDTKRQVLTTHRDVKDLTSLGYRIEVVQNAIEAGAFPPATPGAWWCAPKWCGYWKTCRYVNAERAAKANGGDE